MKEFRSGLRADSVVSDSSASLGEKETWRQLRRELREAGIPESVIKEKKFFIVSWFQEAMASNDFGESDTWTLEPATSHTGLPENTSAGRRSDSSDNSHKPRKQGKKKPVKKQLAVAQSDMERTNHNPAYNSKRTHLEKDNSRGPKDQLRNRLKVALRLDTPIDGSIQQKPTPTKRRIRWATPFKTHTPQPIQDSLLPLKSTSMSSETPQSARTKDIEIPPISTVSPTSETPTFKNAPVPSKTPPTSSLPSPSITASLAPKVPPQNQAPIPSETLSPATEPSSHSLIPPPPQPTVTTHTPRHTVEMGKVDKTPLMVAAEKGDIKMVLLLLYSDANIMEVAKDGSTALHVAAKFGKKEVAQLLLDRGADIEAVENNRWTALHLAARYGGKEVVQLLLDRGADIEVTTTKTGCTALHLAAEYGSTDVTQLLLDRGADIKATTTSNGWTALHFAVHQGHEEVARVLLQHDSKVARKDESTPQLIAPANDDNLAPVLSLPLPGADLGAKDNTGNMPKCKCYPSD